MTHDERRLLLLLAALHSAICKRIGDKAHEDLIDELAFRIGRKNPGCLEESQ